MDRPIPTIPGPVPVAIVVKPTIQGHHHKTKTITILTYKPCTPACPPGMHPAGTMTPAMLEQRHTFLPQVPHFIPAHTAMPEPESGKIIQRQIERCTFLPFYDEWSTFVRLPTRSLSKRYKISPCPYTPNTETKTYTTTEEKVLIITTVNDGYDSTWAPEPQKVKRATAITFETSVVPFTSILTDLAVPEFREPTGRKRVNANVLTYDASNAATPQHPIGTLPGHERNPSVSAGFYIDPILLFLCYAICGGFAMLFIIWLVTKCAFQKRARHVSRKAEAAATMG
jgi:hypothetical protein